MIKWKTVVILCVLILISLVAYFATYNLWSDKNSFDISTTSDQIVASFLNNENDANKYFIEKKIRVTGKIKEINNLNNRYTIKLYTQYKDHYILCDLKRNQYDQLKTVQKNQNVSIIGKCKGFLKDVVLLECTIVSK